LITYFTGVGATYCEKEAQHWPLTEAEDVKTLLLYTFRTFCRLLSVCGLPPYHT